MRRRLKEYLRRINKKLTIRVLVYWGDRGTINKTLRHNGVQRYHALPSLKGDTGWIREYYILGRFW